MAAHTQHELETLRVAVDVVVPSDEWPGGWGGGVRALVDARLHDDLRWLADALPAAVAALDAEAKLQHGTTFVDLSEPDRAATFASVLADATQAPALDALIRVALEGYYAGPSAAGWEMVGFRPVPDDVDVFESTPPDSIDLAVARPAYDVVVIGGGAGGGVAAGVLAESGAHVLLVERAPAWHNTDLRGDHLRGKRMAVYAGNAGPGAGNPRVVTRADGSVVSVDGDANPYEWGLVANCLGGGTRLWQGMAWRFFPEDFAMASTYGIPDGSSMADWPFGYEELAPYYDRAEWEIGVAGPSRGHIVKRTERVRPYPMAPLEGPSASRAYAMAAERLGWSTGPVPFAINSAPRLGRPACVQCPQCIGHACPVDAKNGSHNTLVPRAVASGRCDLVMNAQAVEVLHDGDGRATGVRIASTTGEAAATRAIACDQVVVAAGVVETPRVLLASGLGNEWVGRNLHAHTFALAFAPEGSMPRSYADPGRTSVATLDFVHRDREAWGGGALFDLEMAFPLFYAQLAPALGGPRFGSDHKQWMRSAIGNVTGVMGIGQDVPDSRSRVGIDPRVTDRVGMPAAVVTSVSHPAAAVTTSYLQRRVAEWIRAAGGRGLLDLTPPPGMLAVQEHSAGTCRLGDDPRTSACDPTGRVHGTANVWVADASLHPTNGSVNPGLTVLANAFRVADIMTMPG